MNYRKHLKAFKSLFEQQFVTKKLIHLRLEKKKASLLWLFSNKSQLDLKLIWNSWYNLNLISVTD